MIKTILKLAGVALDTAQTFLNRKPGSKPKTAAELKRTVEQQRAEIDRKIEEKGK